MEQQIAVINTLILTYIETKYPNHLILAFVEILIFNPDLIVTSLQARCSEFLFTFFACTFLIPI